MGFAVDVDAAVVLSAVDLSTMDVAVERRGNSDVDMDEGAFKCRDLNLA